MPSLVRVIARQISTFRRDIFRQRVHVTYFVIARFNNDRQFHFPYRLLPIEIRERSILSLNARVPFVQRARKLHKSRTRVRENKPQLCSNALPLLRLLFTEIRNARTNYANTFARNYRLLERSAVSKNNRTLLSDVRTPRKASVARATRVSLRVSRIRENSLSVLLQRQHGNIRETRLEFTWPGGYSLSDFQHASISSLEADSYVEYRRAWNVAFAVIDYDGQTMLTRAAVYSTCSLMGPLRPLLA